jgi:hypothetical protein
MIDERWMENPPWFDFDSIRRASAIGQIDGALEPGIAVRKFKAKFTRC